jgi:hypothetical protein
VVVTAVVTVVLLLPGRTTVVGGTRRLITALIEQDVGHPIKAEATEAPPEAVTTELTDKPDIAYRHFSAPHSDCGVISWLSP